MSTDLQETGGTPGAAPAAGAAQASPHALLLEDVAVNEHCVGDRWTVQDADRLAQLIAIIAMGQAIHAARIIAELDPAAPAFTHEALLQEAKRILRVVGTTGEERDASRWRRDGFLFEAISWIAARQSLGAGALLKDPHLRSTTQGIDGLIVELDPATTQVVRATICEDKCSEDPRRIFRSDIMTAFRDHHRNSRSAELVATAASLIEKSGANGTAAVEAAARVLDLSYRRYRAALAVEGTDDSEPRRQRLFKNYEDLANITQQQRLGATFVVTGALRNFFDNVADKTTAYLGRWGEETPDV